MLAATSFPYGGLGKAISTSNEYEGTADQNRQLAEAYGYDTGQSLVDQMNNQGMDTSFDARARDFANIGQGAAGLQQPQEMPNPTMFGQRNLSRLGMGPVKNLENPMPPEVAATEEPTVTPESENSEGFFSRFLNYGRQ